MTQHSLAIAVPRRPARSSGLVPIALIWGAGMSAVLVWISPWYGFPVVLAWMIGLTSRHAVDFLLFTATILAAWWAAWSGVYEEATFVPQIARYAEAGTSPWNLLVNLNVWGPRYMVAYPSAWAARTFGLNLDAVWTFFMATVLALEAYVVHRVWLAAQAPRVPGAGARFVTGMLASAAFLTLGVFMHGRLAPAHLGMAMILLGLTRWGRRGNLALQDVFLIGFGLFPLSLMSSGTVLPAAAEVIVGAWIVTFPSWKRRWPSLLWVPLLMLPALPFIFVGYIKNVEFFAGRQGNLWLIVTHGAGKVFDQGALATVAVVLYGGAAILILLRIALARRAWSAFPGVPALVVALPISGVAGLVGYSAMTMGIPALAALGLLAVSPGLARFRRNAAAAVHA